MIVLLWIATIGIGILLGAAVGGSLPQNNLVAYLRGELQSARETIRHYKESVDVLQMREPWSWPEMPGLMPGEEIIKTGCAHCLPSNPPKENI